MLIPWRYRLCIGVLCWDKVEDWKVIPSTANWLELSSRAVGKTVAGVMYERRVFGVMGNY